MNIRTVTEIIIKQSGSSVDDLKLFIQGMAGWKTEGELNDHLVNAGYMVLVYWIIIWFIW